MKRFTTLALSAMLVLLAAVPVAAHNNGDGKMYICHAVAGWGNEGIGYNLIHVNVNAAHGHFENAERHGPMHRVWNVKLEKYLRDFQPTQAQIRAGTCGPIQPPPPDRERFDPSLNVRVCGDPRLILTVNNRRSNGGISIHVSYVSARDGQERHFSRFVPAGERDVLLPRWVVGRSYLRVHATQGDYRKLGHHLVVGTLYAGRLPAATRWGGMTPGGLRCPASLADAIRLARNY